MLGLSAVPGVLGASGLNGVSRTSGVSRVSGDVNEADTNQRCWLQISSIGARHCDKSEAEHLEDTAKKPPKSC